jgi:hypothetical protein
MFWKVFLFAVLEKLIFWHGNSLNFYMSHGNDDYPANYLIQTYYDYNLFVGYNPCASAKSGTLTESYIFLQQFWSFFSLFHSKASMKTNDVKL